MLYVLNTKKTSYGLKIIFTYAEESCGLEWHTRYQIIKGICQGLGYLHKNSIIHLDLKPENILLDANMVPKIADYAYARLLSEDRRTAPENFAASL